MQIAEYDLIVVGSGPGGQRAAIQAAKLGKKVLIVERRKVGGGCLHLGTVPSKTLRECALQLGSARLFLEAFQRKDQVIRNEVKVIKNQLKRNNVTLIEGTARFLDAHTLEISKGKKRAMARTQKIVIAVGTSPIRDPQFPFHLDGMYESDSILSLKKVPSSLLIIGAGVIGCEYASIFQRLGVKVTLVDRRKELLRTMDDEAVASLLADFKRHGTRVLMGATIGSIKRSSGSTHLEAMLNKRKEKFAGIFVCMGREGNIQELDLQRAGVTSLPRGLIEVTRTTFQTNVSHIYAVGDVIGAPALAATSAEQGRIAACHAFSAACDSFPSVFPCGIYTIPEMACIGKHERELQKEKVPYIAGRANYKELARGQILGDDSGFLKLLVHKESHRILGAHIYGAGASELVHIAQMAMQFDAPVDLLVKMVFNYPTLAEAYKVAALHALNQLQGHPAAHISRSTMV